MKIPKKIKIGEVEYTISQKRYFFNKTIGGSINYGEKTLDIKKNTDQKIKEDTFFHEISHGVLKELEFNHPKVSKFRNNEGFVQEMGLILRTTFLDLLRQQRRKK